MPRSTSPSALLRHQWPSRAWTLYPPLLPATERLRRLAKVVGLSSEARARLEWMLWYEAHGRNALKTARHFGIAPKTFHAWKKRFDRDDLRTLETRPSTPRRRRQRAVTRLQEARVLVLKQAHLRYGKRKIRALYEAQYGEAISEWTIQCLITKYQLYTEPAKVQRVNRKRRRSVRRKRITDLTVRPRFGFLVCLDTVHLYWKSTKRVLFTAIDRHSKLAFARLYPSKSTVHAEDFLLRLHYLFDGRMQHVGHDNGSEFQGHFRETCAQLGIPQYHSRVKTPKDNATNERFNRTLQEEFLHFGNRPQTPPVARRVQRPPAAPELRVCDTDVVHPEARERDTEVVILYTPLTNSRKNVSPAALLLAVRACDRS